MFRIVSERLCWWPVTFPGVTEEGEVIENKIQLRFVVLDEDAFPAFLERLGAARPEGDTEPESIRAARTLSEVVRDWRDVAAENGQTLTFSEGNFAALLKVPGVSSAIGRAYIACRQAVPDTREGN